ncbi:hypothetical protein [Zobellia sp. B3R18]|uniref:hypothetical protein n=1 Tax=Zobellia sp. B3R18 TaxID=2841568 RepID=UPI001C07A0D7|nr:hypothetical protein [Zobellia sp. B3R18]MBU2975583.1 hypothetical protein [Zobellia sp. B3R18]
MGLAILKQNVQDWITQQWVILFGEKVDEETSNWLLGPFGTKSGIGEKFIQELAHKEELNQDKSTHAKGILQSINQLKLPQTELDKLSENVIDFYENTSTYNLDLKVKWNPFFKGFGVLLRLLFSNRIEQLNVPIKNNKDSKAVTSEIICLLDGQTKKVKRTIWLRTFKTSGQVVYSGVYETCTIPKGQTCVKAIFPLPNGNATVILSPSVGKNGELILTSSGKTIGDSGFYFLLNDSKGNKWTKFISSFKDKLVVSSENGSIKAVQTLTLWRFRVLSLEYQINKKHSKY